MLQEYYFSLNIDPILALVRRTPYMRRCQILHHKMQLAFSIPVPISRQSLLRTRLFSTTNVRWRCCSREDIDPPRGSWDLKTTSTPSVRRRRPSRDSYPSQNHKQYDSNYRRTYRDNQSPSDTSGQTRMRKDVGPEAQFVREVIDSGDDLLYGISPVLYALKSCRREVVKLFVQDTTISDIDTTSKPSSRKPENDSAIRQILQLAQEKDINVHHLTKGSLCVLARDRPHQGIVLQAGPLELCTLANAPKPPTETKDIYLVLDEITDPQNAGALIRSAHFLGASKIIVCRRHSFSITPVVSKASAGVAEVVKIDAVTSMPRFLNDARSKGWEIVGLGIEDGSEILSEFKIKGPTMIVLGSEGRGLRPLVRRACNEIVKINGNDDCIVDSLNVSVAGAIALFQLMKG